MAWANLLDVLPAPTPLLLLFVSPVVPFLPQDLQIEHKEQSQEPIESVNYNECYTIR
jgi:hypothetical protein